MRHVYLNDQPWSVAGALPELGATAPDFRLTHSRIATPAADVESLELPSLRTVSLGDFANRRKVINIFPSVDTPVCARSVHQFEAYAAKHPADAMLMVSADLPFAMQRFCVDKRIKNVFTLSMMTDRRFARDYGVLIEDGPWAGICARACLVLDIDDTVLHTELVPRIEQEPDYDAAIRHLKHRSTS